MRITHIERSETTDEETVDTLDIPSTDSHTTLTVSETWANESVEETLIKKIGLLQ